MRIFISYSHNDADTPLARYLAARFQAIGIDVWHDEASQVAGGKTLEMAIEKGILDSDHAVFLVSKNWIGSRWSRLELDRFDRRDRSRVRLVPVFRIPPEQLLLPKELLGLPGVTWPEAEPHHDARFWQVYCAVTDTPPGPVETWGERSRGLTKTSVPPPIVRPAGQALDSLHCDRAVQWNAVMNATPERSHDVLIVPGAAGQAHDHFSRRIRERLALMPPRSIVSVHWRKRPAGRDEFFAALAEDMKVSREGLAREMAERMSDSNLVLLHPCLRARFVDASLISYYTDWLPALVQEIQPRMSLKCIQPVEWPPEGGPVASLLSWLRLRPAPADEGKPEAEQFIERVRKESAESIRAIRLQDLTDITPADLDEFCQLEKLTDSQKAWFLSRISSRNPKTSQEVLDAIDAFLADARSVT